MNSETGLKIEILTGMIGFKPVGDLWALGQHEGNRGTKSLVTSFRANNGSELAERVYRASKSQEEIRLHFKDKFGLPTSLPIIGARFLQAEDGNWLVLWVSINSDNPKTNTHP